MLFLVVLGARACSLAASCLGAATSICFSPFDSPAPRAAQIIERYVLTDIESAFARGADSEASISLVFLQ